MRAEGSHVPNKLKWARGEVDLLRFSGIFAKKKVNLNIFMLTKTALMLVGTKNLPEILK